MINLSDMTVYFECEDYPLLKEFLLTNKDSEIMKEIKDLHIYIYEGEILFVMIDNPNLKNAKLVLNKYFNTKKHKYEYQIDAISLDRIKFYEANIFYENYTIIDINLTDIL